MSTTLRKVPLKLGLISVTVRVQGAIEADTSASFSTLCDSDPAGKAHAPAKVRQTLGCPVCKNTDRSSFKKGKETDDGKYAVVDTEKLAKAAEPAPEVKDAINLSAHPADELRFAIPGEKVYYLAPNTGEEDTYALMVDLIETREDVAFCAAFAVRSKPGMYQLGVREGALLLTELAWPGSIRKAPENTGTIDPKMSQMAAMFTDTIIEPFDPATYVDGRAEAVKELLSKTKAVAAGDLEEVSTGTPDDLMAAMAAAVDAKKKPAKKAAKKATKRKAS